MSAVPAIVEHRHEAGLDAGSGPDQAAALPMLVGLVTLALLPRLIYLFFAGDPQNAGDGMTDTYHHWQIAWLTQQVGIGHGFRLWDLKGMEYFWGILHPILLVIAFAVTHSIDIIIPRLLSATFGVVNVVLLFQLCRRYWNQHVGLAVAGLVALAPPIIFTDTPGLVEPIAETAILAGLYSWPERGFLTRIA